MLTCSLFLQMPAVSSSFRIEASACLRLAAPLVIAQLCFVGMTVTDTVLAGRLGEQTLAAVALGGSLWTPPFLFFLGVCAAASPIIAQLYGARTGGAALGVVLRRALRLALLLGLLWWLLMRFISRPVLVWLGLPDELLSATLEYVYALSWGAPGACLFFVLRSGSEGIGQSRPIMACGLSGLAVNALLAYVLMFGRLGLPALGATGAGIATALTLWLMAGGLALFYARHRHYQPLMLFARSAAPGPSGSLEMLRIGLPIGLTLMFEAGIFSFMGLLMARFSGTAVAAHQIALSFAALTFMVPLGVALATTVRVAQAAGAHDAPRVRLAGRTGILLALGFNLVSTFIMLVLPRQIVALYTDAGEVSELAVLLLRLAGLFQLWDALQVAANGALRGIKDTRAPMALTLFAYWGIALPVGYWLGFGQGQGPAGLWIGLIAGLAAAAVLLNARFHALTKPV